MKRCEKHRYRDKREALSASHRRRTSDDNPPDFLRVYLCPFCHGWHMTSQPLLLSEARRAGRRSSLGTTG